MDTELVKTVGQIAGIGGLAIGAFIILFRDVIRKNVFPKLVKEQAYRLLRLILVLVWLVAIFGIAVWAYVETIKRNTSSSSTDNIQQVSGLITDDSGIGLPDVDVFVVGGVERTKTTSSGGFILRVNNEEASYVNLQASKDSYTPWNDYIRIPNTNIRVILKRSNSPPLTNDPIKPGNNAPVSQNVVNNRNRRSRISQDKSNKTSGIIQQSSVKPSDRGKNE